MNKMNGKENPGARKLLSRDITRVINYILDNICPPILRDCKFIMRPIIRIAYGKSTPQVLHFKEKYPFMSDDEIAQYYEMIKDAPINRRATDLNGKCVDYILKNIKGNRILDAACGRGYLLERISDRYKNASIMGADIAVSSNNKHPCLQSDICSLSFEDRSFDTVICTHALEHIRDYRKAIGELCRVAEKRVIIVCPKQREYKYTPDLHVNFMPYMYRFKDFIGIEDGLYLEISGDFVCVLDIHH